MIEFNTSVMLDVFFILNKYETNIPVVVCLVGL